MALLDLENKGFVPMLFSTILLLLRVTLQCFPAYKILQTCCTFWGAYYVIVLHIILSKIVHTMIYTTSALSITVTKRIIFIWLPLSNRVWYGSDYSIHPFSFISLYFSFTTEINRKIYVYFFVNFHWRWSRLFIRKGIGNTKAKEKQYI